MKGLKPLRGLSITDSIGMALHQDRSNCGVEKEWEGKELETVKEEVAVVRREVLEACLG